jgi:ribonuclease VapC
MIIDSSAIIAILEREPEVDDFTKLIAEDGECAICAPTYVEASIIVERRRSPVLRREFDDLIVKALIRIEPFTEQHARIAREAYRDYGKGSGHPAQLNIGDCFSYALARATGEALLFKGDDFIHTDLRAAHRPTQ